MIVHAVALQNVLVPVQVSQLEAGMLILTILIALGFGTWCLGILDTPTRFATPKEHDR